MLNYWLADFDLRDFVYMQFNRQYTAQNLPIHIFEFNNQITKKAVSSIIPFAEWLKFGRSTFDYKEQTIIDQDLSAFNRHICCRSLNLYESSSVIPPTMLVHYQEDTKEIRTEMLITKFLESKKP